MTVLQLYEQIGHLPTSFILEDGNRFEISTKENTLGDFITSVWQMEGTKRVHLYNFAVGSSKEEAERNLVNKNITFIVT